MPSYVPRMLEPHKKRETLEKREAALLHALGHSANRRQLQNRAAKLREAQIAVLKAKYEVIHYQVINETISEERRDAILKQLANIDESMTEWVKRSNDQIIEEYRAKYT